MNFTGKLLAILLVLLIVVIFMMIILTRNNVISVPIAVTEEETVEREYKNINIEIETVGDIVVEHNYIAWDQNRRPGEVRDIKYITIHETDNRNSGAGAQTHNTFLTGNNEDITGWHYTVDDHSIVHNIPDNEIAWNAGDQRTKDGGNMNGIAIEMCVNVTNDYEATLINTAELAAKLMVTYDLTPEDLRFHCDFMDKVCPHRLITEGRLEEFRELVQEKYDALTAENTSDDETEDAE